MMSKELDKRLGKSIDMATRLKHEYVNLEHFLFCLCEAPLIVSIFEELNISPSVVKTDIKFYIDKLKVLPKVDANWKSDLTISVHRVFERAALQMQNAGKNELSGISQTSGCMICLLQVQRASFLPEDKPCRFPSPALPVKANSRSKPHTPGRPCGVRPVRAR